MELQNTPTSYGSVAKFFHWTVFFILFFQILFGYFLDDIPNEYKSTVYNLHKLTGLLILALMLLRGLWALLNPKPKLPEGNSALDRLLERTVHFLLYATVIAMPLCGWIGSIAGGRPPHIGDFHFELPIQQSKSLSDAAFNAHGLLAIIIIVLFVLHASAALYHHFFRKDNVLTRML